ncbi:hypothetical protein FBQ85_07565 [Cytophagia bacterium CHB2]|nr:hypothetical protein [Cytophagia bacterium CHB2]
MKVRLGKGLRRRRHWRASPLLTCGEAGAQRSEAQPKDVVPGQRYSLLFMLHDAIQHDLYHAGQIVLLKNA